MIDFVLDNEVIVRLFFFFGVLATMMAWERAVPRRVLSLPRALRWYANLGIVALNSVVLRLVFPVALVGVALIAEQRDWGLFNVVDIPRWLAILGGAILLDFAIYLQHIMVHAVPMFWRLHRMHHADMDYDVTTGARFHPIEILLSGALKMVAVVLLGAPAISVVIFEVLLNATAMFNHANVKLPEKVDSVLRLFVVTPDMHRIHHSVLANEANSNFGFNFPWWDRAFGTYMDQPKEGHLGMTIGIDLFRKPEDQHLHRMLIQPFLEGDGDYAINRRDFKK
jgi:sterol desaturase/sphingolipid hydroxylase (fatty acid hydroxylase superfamily)